jgi:hypothetical protein
VTTADKKKLFFVNGPGVGVPQGCNQTAHASAVPRTRSRNELNSSSSLKTESFSSQNQTSMHDC